MTTSRRRLIGTWTTLRRGLVWGGGFATLLSLLAWVVLDVGPGGTLTRAGLTWRDLVIAYFGSGIFGGVVFGAFWPLRRHWLVAPALGFLTVLPITGTVAVVAMPSDSSVVARCVVAAIGALVTGAGGAIAFRDEFSETSG